MARSSKVRKVDRETDTLSTASMGAGASAAENAVDANMTPAERAEAELMERDRIKGR